MLKQCWHVSFQVEIGNVIKSGSSFQKATQRIFFGKYFAGLQWKYQESNPNGRKFHCYLLNRLRKKLLTFFFLFELWTATTAVRIKLHAAVRENAPCHKKTSCTLHWRYCSFLGMEDWRKWIQQYIAKSWQSGEKTTQTCAALFWSQRCDFSLFGRIKSYKIFNVENQSAKSKW